MRYLLLVSLCSVFLFSAAGSGLLAAAPGEKGALTGRWKTIFERDGQDRDYYFDLIQDGEKITGDFISPRSGKYPIKSGSVHGDTLKIAVERTYSGITAQLDIEGKLDGKRKMSGGVTVRGNDIAGITMTRLPDPAGTWKVKSYAPDGENSYESVLKVVRSEKGYKGTFTGERGTLQAKSIAWKEDGLVIALALPLQDRDVDLSIEATFKGRNSLTGRWKVGDSEYAGKWGAVREVKEPVHSLVGRWNVVSKSGERSTESVMEIVADGDGYKGRYKGRRGELTYKRVSFDEDEVRLELEVDVQGESVTFVVKAVFKDKDSLEGRWQVKDFDEYAGEWTARRDVKKAPAKEAK